jgi:hypothetical protein
MGPQPSEHFAPWGHPTPPIQPEQIVANIARELEFAIPSFKVLPEGPIPCDQCVGFSRVSVVIPLSETLFDQLMNGASGYRAHYAVSIEQGEAFNAALIEATAPQIIDAEFLYGDKFDRRFCERSLLGSFSKFWYPKSLTDEGAGEFLLHFDEELLVPHWKLAWSNVPKPRKGLLAPMVEGPAVLLNGTFVDDAGAEFEQKPNRSLELHSRGWT